MEINGVMVSGLSEIPIWQDGEQVIQAVVTCDKPLSDESLAALSGCDWSITQEGTVRSLAGMGDVNEVRYRFGQTATSLGKVQAELEQVLADARAGLISAPMDGEDWDASKWYRAGDVVNHSGVSYRCEKTCKAKEPGIDTLIVYWTIVEEETPVEVLVWADLESGATITVGQIVTHNEKTWKCLKEHAKSIIRQPSAIQTEYWEEVTL